MSSILGHDATIDGQLRTVHKAGEVGVKKAHGICHLGRIARELGRGGFVADERDGPRVSEKLGQKAIEFADLVMESGQRFRRRAGLPLLKFLSQ